MRTVLPVIALTVSVLTAGPAPTGMAAETLPAGMVLHMDFDQARQQKIPNLEGVASGGTGVDAKFVPVQGAGQALSIRQNNDRRHYVEVADHAEFNRDAFTVAAWVCPRRIDIGGTIVCKHDWVEGGGRGFVLRSTSTNLMNFTLGAGGWISTNSTTLLRPHHWVHVAAVFDGSKLFVYFDGKVESNHQVPKPYNASPYPLRIGHAAYSLDRHRKFDGKIDDVMIWNRALEAEELAAVFQATRKARPPAPTAEDIATLIQHLGADRFQDRETAQHKLLDLGPMVLPALQKHSEDADPELRVRARTLLKTLSSEKEKR